MTIDEFSKLIKCTSVSSINLNIKTPIDYNLFMVKIKGSGLFQCRFDYKDLYLPLHVVLSFDEVIKESKCRPDIPRGFIPIIDDLFGDYLILGSDDDVLGMIFIVDHEDGPDENWDREYSTASHIKFLANSFTEFIDVIQPRYL